LGKLPGILERVYLIILKVIKKKKRIITNKNLNGRKVNILFRRLLD